MNTYSTHWRPSSGLRLTALFTAVVVMMLGIFAASSELHAWLHDHGKVVTPHHRASAGHDQPLSDQDEDGCVIVLFANGVIAASLALVAIASVWRLINLVMIVRTHERRQSLRYWLPPLCGPPQR